tara:strand:- start:282 stop:554 length:273 start_codon:yes stop_codon:yes gene_type:complete
VKNKPIWKSYVWHEDNCYLVSTIERIYDTIEGETHGPETLVWKYDCNKRERGDMIHQGGGGADHKMVCMCIMTFGVLPSEDNPSHNQFFI